MTIIWISVLLALGALVVYTSYRTMEGQRQQQRLQQFQLQPHHLQQLQLRQASVRQLQDIERQQRRNQRINDIQGRRRMEMQQQLAQQQQQPDVVLPLSSDGPPFSQVRNSKVQTEVSTTGRLAQLEQMMQPAAKAAIEIALYKYLSCSLPSVTNPEMPSWHLERAIQIMEEYESSERMVQLELAVWKALCIVEMPDCGYYQAREWMTNGWKPRKAQHRDSNAASIILGAVKNFLE